MATDITNITYECFGFDPDICPEGWEAYKFRGEYMGHGIIGIAPISPRLAADKECLLAYAEKALQFHAEENPLPT